MPSRDSPNCARGSCPCPAVWRSRRHVFSDSPSLVTDVLAGAGCQYDLERKQVVKHRESRVFSHVHVFDRFNFELTIYPEDRCIPFDRKQEAGKCMVTDQPSAGRVVFARAY